MSFKEKFKEKFRDKKVRIGAIIAIILLIAGGYYFYQKAKMNNIGMEEGMTEFIETYSIPENEKIFINGSIIPKESKKLSLEAGYEVSKLNVSNGQYVNKGDALFTVKSNEVLTQIQDLEQQVKDLNNQKNQVSSNPEQPADVSSIDSEIAKTNSEIKKLKNKSSITTYAPFSGKVYMNESTQSPEEVASYMTLESTEYYMKGKVSEQDLPKLQKDLGVDIYIFATEGKLTGKISSISDRPSSGEESVEGMPGSSLSYYDVSVDFDTQENLTNGFHIQASVEVESKNPKIPTSAMMQDEGGTFVYKVFENKIVKQPIEIENKTDDFTVLKSGLMQNDTIIKYPTEEMKEGDEVPVDSTNMEDLPSEGGETMDKTIGKVGM